MYVFEDVLNGKEDSKTRRGGVVMAELDEEHLPARVCVARLC